MARATNALAMPQSVGSDGEEWSDQTKQPSDAALALLARGEAAGPLRRVEEAPGHGTVIAARGVVLAPGRQCYQISARRVADSPR